MGGATRAHWIVLILAAGAVFAIALADPSSNAERAPDEFDLEMEQAARDARRDRWQGRSKTEKVNHAAPAPGLAELAAEPPPPPPATPEPPAVEPRKPPATTTQIQPLERATPVETAEPVTTDAPSTEPALVTIEPVFVATTTSDPPESEGEGLVDEERVEQPVTTQESADSEPSPASNVEFVVEPPSPPANATPRPRDPVATSGPPQAGAEPDVRTAATDDGSKIAKGDARLDGRIRQPNGTPVTGIEVSLRPQRGKEVVATAFTDDNGEYSFPSVPAGRYRLDLGPAAAPIAWAPDRLRLDTGENKYDLRSPALGNIVVRIEDENKVAVSDALVLVTEVYGRRWKSRTGENGVATFNNLPADDYRVMVMHQRRRIAQVSQVLFANASPEVVLVLPSELPPSPLDLAKEEEREFEAAKRATRKAGPPAKKKGGGNKKKQEGAGAESQESPGKEPEQTPSEAPAAEPEPGEPPAANG